MIMKLLGLFICWQVAALVIGIVGYGEAWYSYEQDRFRSAKMYFLAAELIAAGVIAVMVLFAVGLILIKKG